MGKRADDVAETRLRIVEAAVHLHGTIGLSATTISALAEEAGVTRLTVYRHFPDESTLISACSRHWLAAQALPDPQTWGQIPDPAERMRVGLADVYRYYRDGQAMLTNVTREFEVMPADLQEEIAGMQAAYRDTLLAPFRSRGAHRTLLKAVLGHIVAFPTWRSLTIDNGLSNDQAVQVMTDLALATASRRGAQGWARGEMTT